MMKITVIRNTLIFTIVIFNIFLGIAQAQSFKADDRELSILYRLIYKDKVSFLFGTFHIRDIRFKKYETILFEIVDSCDIILQESNSNLIDAESSRILLSSDIKLSDRITVEDYQLIKDKIESFWGEQQIEDFEYSSLYAISNYIFSRSIVQTFKYTIEEYIGKYAQSLDKKFEYIEDADFQIQLLQGLPDSLFLDYLKNIEDRNDLYRKSLDYYFSGKLDSLELLPENDSLKEYLFKSRNENFNQTVWEALTTGNRIFIMVGYGHLQWENGMLNFLRRKGVEVIRIILE